MKITRRDLIRAGSLAAALSALNWPALVKAAGEAVKEGLVNIVWFEAQSCTGDTVSIIQATDPSLLDVLLGTTPLVGPGMVRLIFHEAVMPQWGTYHIKETTDVADHKILENYVTKQPPPGDAMKLLEEIAEGKYGPYVLVLEGSFPQEYGIPGTNIEQKGGYYCHVGHRTCTEWAKLLFKNAIAVVTVGNCSSYGGLVANKVLEPPPGFKYPSWSPSPTGAVGMFDDPVRGTKGMIHISYFQPEVEPFRKYIDEGGVPDFKTMKPAVAVPGCPANGNGILRTLALLTLVAAGLLKPDVLERKAFLDQYARPRFIFENTVHEQCPRAGSYAAGDLRPYPGAGDYRCLFAVGCKGPIANCPWNKVGWVNGVGGPTRTGGVCIGCTMPGFTDAFEPFYAPLNAPRLPTLETLGVALGGAALLGVAGAYLASKAAKPKEEKK
ncbi:Nickel-iron dehydrogenase small subunit, N-terminal domain protein [Pyrobaculum islandicum DSM 4184]|uniref:Nickel-iron dehydrogenase small subunit, N-terminal domain protein n=1 Tax=Pyrobaculum islandicum (strain DSM 4184 / JCM 9189 / GEO3) TaxID=384616 RepID=A1RR00_PYRIL|nr:hyaluronate lyase [Pyrobaculum islandicum]ABL87382.1 Nickel-iron dehydrogenase small subunit, N-terminal domain protein [Pyrobaculum islandicum DSM 4184]